MWLPLAIIALVFSFVLMIIKMAQEHETQKLSLTRGADKSLTVSELNEMVEAAVQEAIEPLKERIRELERDGAGRIEEHPQLEGSSRRLELDDWDVEEPEENMLPTGRKKVH